MRSASSPSTISPWITLQVTQHSRMLSTSNRQAGRNTRAQTPGVHQPDECCVLVIAVPIIHHHSLDHPASYTSSPGLRISCTCNILCMGAASSSSLSPSSTISPWITLQDTHHHQGCAIYAHATYDVWLLRPRHRCRPHPPSAPGSPCRTNQGHTVAQDPGLPGRTKHQFQRICQSAHMQASMFISQSQNTHITTHATTAAAASTQCAAQSHHQLTQLLHKRIQTHTMLNAAAAASPQRPTHAYHQLTQLLHRRSKHVQLKTHINQNAAAAASPQCAAHPHHQLTQLLHKRIQPHTKQHTAAAASPQRTAHPHHQLTQLAHASQQCRASLIRPQQHQTL